MRVSTEQCHVRVQMLCLHDVLGRAADLAKAGNDGGVLALSEHHNARPGAVFLGEGGHLRTCASTRPELNAVLDRTRR